MPAPSAPSDATKGSVYLDLQPTDTSKLNGYSADAYLVGLDGYDGPFLLDGTTFAVPTRVTQSSNNTGRLVMELYGNDLLVPAGSYWQIDQREARISKAVELVAGQVLELSTVVDDTFPTGGSFTPPRTFFTASIVRLAATGNVTIATGLNAGDTIDGQTLAAGDRVLLPLQSTPAQNGVYVAGVTPTRSTDFDTWASFVGATIDVTAGTANSGTLWRCTVASGGTLGTTAITFDSLSGSSAWADITGTPTTLAGYGITDAAAALTSDQNYVTDAQLVVIGNTSGSNSGDNAANALYGGLAGNITYASSVAVLDSNLTTGGGTDDTTVLQTALNALYTAGGGMLVIDGVARITSLRIKGNCSIVGLGWHTGFFQGTNANAYGITNYNHASDTDGLVDIVDENIALRNFTINGNNANQSSYGVSGGTTDIHMPIMMAGVRGYRQEGVQIIDAKTFACRFSCMDDFVIRYHRSFWNVPAVTNDGVHLNCPLKNGLIEGVYSNGDDDAVGLNTDEMLNLVTPTFPGGVYHGQGIVAGSGATEDITIRNIYCNGANQGVRVLNQASRCDRILIDGVHGTIGSYAVSLNTTNLEGPGNCGSIIIRNISVADRVSGSHYGQTNAEPVPYWNVVSVNLAVEDLDIQTPSQEQITDGRPIIYMGDDATVDRATLDGVRAYIDAHDLVPMIQSTLTSVGIGTSPSKPIGRSLITTVSDILIPHTKTDTNAYTGVFIGGSDAQPLGAAFYISGGATVADRSFNIQSTELGANLNKLNLNPQGGNTSISGNTIVAGTGTLNLATYTLTAGATGTVAITSGNIATATALETARTIGGTSFDGTANIVPGTITVADTASATSYVALFESATGDLAPKTDAALTYNASTGGLAATSINGLRMTLGGGAVTSNVAVGATSLNANTFGAMNTAIGSAALVANTSGQENTALGESTLVGNISGKYNTAVGSGALYTSNVDGGVAIGYYAGKYETAANKFFINNQDRANESGDRTLSLLYGTFAGTAAAQQLTINAGTLTITGTVALGGSAITYGALPSGATTIGTLATYAAQTYTVTGTNTATQFGAIYHGAPTFTDASAGTVTDLYSEMWDGPPVAAGSLTGTRKHSIIIRDSTSAASSITGGLVVATTLGTAATSVGIGGGNINAGGTITGGGAFVITGANASADNSLGTFTATPAAAANSAALTVSMAAGYTGALYNRCILAVNSSAGTGTDLRLSSSNASPYVNAGANMWASATTAGTNVGNFASAEGGNKNIALVGRSTQNKANATNIAVAGFASQTTATPIQIGGFFGLMTSEPTYASAALIADNGTTTSDIFVARDNGTAVFTVADGGAVTITGACSLNGNVALGNASTDLIGFYGATAVDQPAAVADVSVGAVPQTAAGATDCMDKINLILARLRELGLIAT